MFFFFFGMKFDLKKKTASGTAASQMSCLEQNSIVTKVKLNESKFQQIYCFFSKYMGWRSLIFVTDKHIHHDFSKTGICNPAVPELKPLW